MLLERRAGSPFMDFRCGRFGFVGGIRSSDGVLEASGFVSVGCRRDEGGEFVGGG